MRLRVPIATRPPHSEGARVPQRLRPIVAEVAFWSSAPLAHRLLCYGANLQESRVFHQLFHDEEGQSTVEYMLLISVIVIAMVAAAYVFVPTFKEGVADLARDVKKILSDGKIGGVGTSR